MALRVNSSHISEQTRWRYKAVAIVHKLCHLPPVDIAEVEAQANPSASTKVGREEVALAIAPDEQRSAARHGLARQRHKTIAMVVVQEPCEASFAHPEHSCQTSMVIEHRRPLNVLGSLRQGETYRSQSAEATARGTTVHHRANVLPQMNGPSGLLGTPVFWGIAAGRDRHLCVLNASTST
jgi:hypothetical protein